MSERMKQRAVGAVVLVALAIIFVPMFLDYDNDRHAKSSESVIPPKPDSEIKTVSIPIREWSEKTVADVLPKSRDRAEPISDDPAIAPVVIEKKKSVAVAKALQEEPPKPVGKTEKRSKVASAAVESKASEKKVLPSSQQKSKAEPTKTSVEKLKPQLAKLSNPSRAWVVQVGSFSKRTNAEKLRNRLRKSGYRAFMASSKSNGRTVVRVRIGPELLRSEANKIKRKVEKELKLQAMVLKYR